ncbi:MAG: ABC transporter substrate-binding protein [Clostridiaceae bacterium]|jgi:ABC-type nitrate/sulfonate/bicarbonate transport system substrate-binding protein|nr:ABC transporter substrate-binding protein [Clostridiaceae bacterium]
MKKADFLCLILILIVISIILAGCSNQNGIKITVVLDWTPNTNHTGLYAALEQGFFKDEGLEVEIMQPQEGTAEQLVAAGSAQFGISYQENVIFARSENVPVVSLSAVIQHNTSGFASLKEKGIVSPKDFENKKYGGWGSPIEEATLRYLMEKNGADPDKLQIVTIGDADFFQASATGEIDYAWIFEGWAGIEAGLKGMELNYIDLGKVSEVFDYYTPVIITSEETLSKEKEMVEKFMKAVEKGYYYSMENPEEAAEILLKHTPELDRELVVESQKFLASKYQDDAPYWGMQKQEVWERYMNWLYEYGFIADRVDVSKAFTNEFLNRR